ncbi:MAG: NusG domain II-containing protein [Clostridia bacterium]|nr:NusG domain II-containing protein [Clostridia bacterium]
MKKKRLFLDLGLLFVFLLLALLLFLLLPKKESSSPVIVLTVDGTEVWRRPLTEEGDYVIRNGDDENVLRISGGAAWVISSNCPQHICEQTGKISSPGETIVCLPHRVFLEIVGGDT